MKTNFGLHCVTNVKLDKPQEAYLRSYFLGGTIHQQILTRQSCNYALFAYNARSINEPAVYRGLSLTTALDSI